MAEVLIHNGASVDLRDHMGRTPLYAAAHSPPPGTKEVALYLVDRGAELELNSALALRMEDRVRALLTDPQACRNAPSPELLPRLVVRAALDAIKDAVGRSAYTLMEHRGEYHLDPAVVDAVVAGHLELLRTILAQGVPMGRRGLEALGIALELPHPAFATLPLEAGACSTDCSARDQTRLIQQAERSACKDKMLRLLQTYGIKQADEPPRLS